MNTKFNEVMSKQHTKLKVIFTERVLHTANPCEHYYVVTHCDETGKVRINVDKTYDVSKVNWDLRDEVYAEWIKDKAGKHHLMLTVHVGVEDDAGDRKRTFKQHISEVVGYIIHADAMLMIHMPALMDSPVAICYHDGYDCSDIEELGLVKEHAHTALKK